MTVKTRIAAAISVVTAAAVGVAACGGGESGGGEQAAGEATVVQASSNGPPGRICRREASTSSSTRPSSRPRSTTRTGRWSRATRGSSARPTPSAATRRVVVEVTDETKTIANGIEARVIRDTVTENGRAGRDHRRLVRPGLGRATSGTSASTSTNYENGKVVDHSGSFEAGVDGAEAGVVMPADPEPGMTYRQEYYKGEAEDKGAVVTRRRGAGPGARSASSTRTC